MPTLGTDYWQEDPRLSAQQAKVEECQRILRQKQKRPLRYWAPHWRYFAADAMSLLAIRQKALAQGSLAMACSR